MDALLIKRILLGYHNDEFYEVIWMMDNSYHFLEWGNDIDFLYGYYQRLRTRGYEILLSRNCTKEFRQKHS